MSETARLIIEVTAGVVPGTPEKEYTRQYVLTSRQWHEARESDAPGAEQALLAEFAGRAQGYAALMMHPNTFNWVRTDWIWL